MAALHSQVAENTAKFHTAIISQAGLSVLFAFQVNMRLSAASQVEVTALLAADAPEINRDDGALWWGEAGNVWPCVLA